VRNPGDGDSRLDVDIQLCEMCSWSIEALGVLMSGRSNRSRRRGEKGEREKKEIGTERNR
jgi:hypothetical protein